MGKEINLQEYEIIDGSTEAICARAAELLDLSPDSSEEAIKDYIGAHYEWYRDDEEEYRYMGYDCGDCYTGGDIKKGIICGDFIVACISWPGRKQVRIYKKI